ncbi:hypothetical protein [Geodermatophilus normandii]|uniref:hypothetical protein n=1 Tax=Geodermatophilus normandii TaxID=1137989 RepID=UPI000D70A7C3|nr:hypothetical protein [Geodermatophilus normandii]
MPSPGRPLTAPFAAVFGLLVAAEDLYLGWLLWAGQPAGWGRHLAVSAVLALLAVAGAALVWLGRGRGWLVLTAAAALPLLLLLGVAALFGALGDDSAVGWALLLLVGPVGCLTLAVRRPIREWTRPGRATPRTPPSAGPRRDGRAR